MASDDEKTVHKKKKKKSRDDDDETWSPTGKLGNVGSRHSKGSRDHAKKKSVEEGLKEAASRPLKIKVINVNLSVLCIADFSWNFLTTNFSVSSDLCLLHRLKSLSIKN